VLCVQLNARVAQRFHVGCGQRWGWSLEVQLFVHVMVQNLRLALKAEDFAGYYIQNQLVACFLVLIIDMLLARAIQIIVF
jgi:hypothetical protein